MSLRVIDEPPAPRGPRLTRPDLHERRRVQEANALNAALGGFMLFAIVCAVCCAKSNFSKIIA